MVPEHHRHFGESRFINLMHAGISDWLEIPRALVIHEPPLIRIEPLDSDIQPIPDEPIDWSARTVDVQYVLKNGPDGKTVAISSGEIDMIARSIEDRFMISTERSKIAKTYIVADKVKEILDNLVKIEDGDTDGVLRFVSRYGLLGRFRLLPSEMLTTTHSNSDELKRWMVSVFGDPLEWIFAHAKTLRWCLDVTYRINTLKNEPNANEIFQAGFETRIFNAKTPWMAIRDVITKDDLYPESDDDYLWWLGARRVCDEIINANIAGVKRTQKTDRKGNVRSHYYFVSLIEAVYWYLADAREGGRIHQCEADDCRTVFIQTDASQRFCRPALGEKESKCSRRQRIKRYRSDPEKREREKQLQRERYHRDKES